jgi:tRNA nucleotidyltransferase (CCA-adding enzyme)
MTRAFLERIGIKSAIIDQVEPLVESHMVTTSIGREPSARAVRRLAMRLAPATIAQLLRVIEADYSGRPPLPQGLPDGAARIQEIAEAQEVKEGPPSPLILGRHVLPYFDGRPGIHIGDATRAAYEAQADGEFSNEPEALLWLDRYMKGGTGFSR